MTFKPSPYQEAIFNWIKTASGNAVVNAVAGSGKTTTIVQAAQLIPADTSGVFVAFNNHIVQELKGRLAGTPMTASTVHSIGRSTIAKTIKKLSEPDTAKYRKIAKQEVEDRHPYRDQGTKRIMADVLYDLADKARQTLTSETDTDALYQLTVQFNIDLPKDIEGKYIWKDIDAIFAMFPEVLKAGEELARGGVIDFTDMLYLPYRWQLTPNQVKWVFADEIQDFNAAQLDLVCKLVGEGGRFIGVGDPHQSIMGFAGADSESFWKIKARMNATELPLSVCYRCPTKHINLAKGLVPHIEAAPGKEEGIVTYVKNEQDLYKIVQTGDLIICRKTAPVVTACIALIAKGIAAKVRGRNVSKTLTDLAKQVAKMRTFKFSEFVKHLEEYKDNQIRVLVQKDGTEDQIENLRDRVDALTACYERYTRETEKIDQEIFGLCESIESLFSDDNPGVWLSTIHRAKGLEADRVLFLQRDKCPLVWENQRPDQYEQEENLLYVGLTRAKKELILFGKEPSKQLALPEPQTGLTPANDVISKMIVEAALDDVTLTVQDIMSVTSSPMLPPNLTDGLSSLRKVLEAAVEYGKTLEPDPLAELKALKATDGALKFDEPKVTEIILHPKPHPVPDWDQCMRTFEINMLFAKIGRLTETQKARLEMLRGTPTLIPAQPPLAMVA